MHPRRETTLQILSDLIGFPMATLAMSGISLSGLFVLVTFGSVAAKRKGG